jgi:hydrogenase maturation protease
MKGVLVIACGNPLRRDDGLAWQAVQALEGVEVRLCQGLTPELAEALSQVERAVFVDADVSAPPGALSFERLEPEELPEAFSHHLEPPGLLALTGSLYGRAPEACLLSLGVADIGYGEGLSPVVQEAMPMLIERLRDCLHAATAGSPERATRSGAGEVSRA